MISIETLNEVYRESRHGWVGRGPGILLSFQAANIGERFADIKAGRTPRVAVTDIKILYSEDRSADLWWERGRYEPEDLCLTVFLDMPDCDFGIDRVARFHTLDGRYCVVLVDESEEARVCQLENGNELLFEAWTTGTTVPTSDDRLDLRPHWRRVRIDTYEDKAHYLRIDGKTWIRWWSGTTSLDEAADLDEADYPGAVCQVDATMVESVAKYKASKVLP